jgi:hypothetical protein
VSNEIDFKILQRIRPTWHFIKVAADIDVFAPLIEARIAEWVATACHASCTYKRGCGLFSDQADAALFRTFWG